MNYLFGVSEECVSWKQVADITNEGVFFVNENLESWDPHYAVRAEVNGDLLIMNWSPVEAVARGVDTNGQAVETSTWEHMVVDHACSYVWVKYWAGDPIPEGAVVGGRLADGTPLYVVVTLSLSARRPIGYYNPQENTFDAYWIIPMTYSGAANILVKV